jgi:hypothetical protein
VGKPKYEINDISGCVEPLAILGKLREQSAPLIRIATGPVENLAEVAPITAKANEYIEDWLANPENMAGDTTPQAMEQDYVETAAWMHSVSWKYTQDDAEAFSLARACIYEAARNGNKGAAKFLPHVMTTDAWNCFGWYGKWYHYGAQSVEIEDKFAANLAATKIATSELEHVELPWPIFLIRAPKFLQGMPVNGEPLKHILVDHVRLQGATAIHGREDLGPLTSDSDMFRLTLLTVNKYRVLRTVSLDQWANPNPRMSFDEFRLTKAQDYDEIEVRKLEVIGRIVLGALISLNDPKANRRYGKLAPDAKPSIGSPRYGTPNDVVLHKLGRPVKVDARETVGDYVAGRTGRVTNVRTLVAGHWKWQPHGPKSSLRRWQHVECYWRGDEDAPRIIRPHVLGGGE